MERAATKCFQWIKNNYPKIHPVIIVCGNGNNGGDGLVIARHLKKAGYAVKLFILQSTQYSDDFNIQFNLLKHLKIPTVFIKKEKDFPAHAKNNIIIEALFGTGLNRPLTGIAASLIKRINQSNLPIISIDVPGGIQADGNIFSDNIIQATHTLTFETPKLAYFIAGQQAYFGSMHLINIQLNKDYYKNTIAGFETIDKTLIKSIYRARNKFSHKYNFGHALIFAGSQYMMGAAILCLKACLRSGAGLTTLHIHKGVEQLIQASVPEAITSIEKDLTKLLIKKTAIAIGPGITITPGNKKLLKSLLLQEQIPLVIDATALQMLKPLTSLLIDRSDHPAILTPHTGEFDTLFGTSNDATARIHLSAQKAKELNCYIILKGHHTIIACPDGTNYINTNGNAGMATAGSGDTLTGILTSLLAQAYPEKHACILGVYLHGLAGDIAANNFSEESMIASDIINSLGDAFIKINH